LTFVVEMRRYRAPGGATVNIAAALLSCTYVGLLTSLLAHIRLIAGNVEGIFALVSLLVVVKLSDTGAYTVGRLVGRHKLAPTLSPGKTIEGAVGGFAFAVVGSWLFFYALVPALIGGDARGPAWWACLLYAVTLTAAGMVGDLAESLLKRDLGCKDSSRWLPGLGGVLDVMDSILAAAPVGYLWWASGWMTTG